MDSLRILDVVPPTEAIIHLFVASALRRPVREPERIASMYANSPLVRSAWIGEKLVGLMRGWHDGSFDGFIADLAVDPEHHNRGIGRALLDSLAALGPEIQWVLLASPLALDYYQKLGWTETDKARLFSRQSWNPEAPATWRDRHLDLLPTPGN
ncbi:MAG: GNAT family N-acetyltransferase [Fibrobacteria bacterium]|nr:GNAT family N-acetyltransferase [Fibrobacteria bacterium]